MSIHCLITLSLYTGIKSSSTLCTLLNRVLQAQSRASATQMTSLIFTPVPGQSTPLPVAVNPPNIPISQPPISQLEPPPALKKAASRMCSFLSTIPSPWECVGPSIRHFFGRVKKKLKSPNRSTIIVSLIIGTIFGVPTWLSLRLAAWTSKKDFYMHCLEQLVSVVL